MLNLSDKELDRLSREAADQHDPGDLLGPRAWHRLEKKLDSSSGNLGRSPFRSIRRLPFYYAPAVLLFVGLSYWGIRQFSGSHKTGHSGSPPTAGQQASASEQQASASVANNNNYSTTQINDNAHKATSTPDARSTQEPGASSTASPSSALPTTGADASGNNAIKKDNAAGNNATVNNSTARTNNAAALQDATALHGVTSLHSSIQRDAPINARSDLYGSSTANNTGDRKAGASLKHKPGKNQLSATAFATGNSAGAGIRDENAANAAGIHSIQSNANTKAYNKNVSNTSAGNSKASNSTANAGLSKTRIQSVHSFNAHPRISDSALRAWRPATASNPANKGKALHINRSLEIGAVFAPDFASVNSLAGDKPGTSLGLTLDYRVLNRLHLNSGLIYSTKIYTSRVQDFHVPYDYLRSNNLKNVDFIKGSLKMLEIPLNIRYDFSVTGNTILYAETGLSSYFLPNENCNYYFNYFGREAYRSFKYSEKNSYLFSALNISLGIETGISNSLSLRLAPYIKVPTGDIGFGEIKMSSVGINVGLQFAPVLSRKRQ